MEKPWPLVRPQKDIKTSASGQTGGVLGVATGWAESLQMEQTEFAHMITRDQRFSSRSASVYSCPACPASRSPGATPQSSPVRNLHSTGTCWKGHQGRLLGGGGMELSVRSLGGFARQIDVPEGFRSEVWNGGFCCRGRWAVVCYTLTSRKHPLLCSLKDTDRKVTPRRMFGRSCPYEYRSLPGGAGRSHRDRDGG